MAKNNVTEFLAMWCNTGLESIINLSEWNKKTSRWEKESIFSILKDTPHPPRPTLPVKHMIARARANSDRQYELYTFTAGPGIHESDLTELFETNPQFIVDFIRKNGSCVFSDKRKNDHVVIN